MPGAHDEKLIAEKYAIDYPRRPLATRLWKRRWNWLALFLACLVGFVLYYVQGNRAFWAGPVSHAHAAFAMDCQKCHTSSWESALRLASLDSGRHSVPNTACLNCHPTVGDHHPRLGEQAQLGNQEPACATCHQEHRPEMPLLEVADHQCASCHGNLETPAGSESHFMAEVISFDEGTQGHPEFAFFRKEGIGTQHGIHQVAVQSEDGTWVDNGGVLFNHKVHLAPDGVLDANRQKVQLTCADCHVPEGDGKFMQPIVYEQHCASCHPLKLADDLAALGELPHAAPELVRGAIRERVAKTLTQPTPAETPPTIRRLPAPAILSDPQAESADAMLAAADHAVFGLEAKGLCRKCHHVEIQDGNWYVPTLNPQFVASEINATRATIPHRWLSHGEFNHGAHLTVACADCHNVTSSTLTSDILLPGIANCRKCHGSHPVPPNASIAADCVLCHDYHGPTKPATKVADVAKLLTFFEIQEVSR
jgi:hypothetical protein